MAERDFVYTNHPNFQPYLELAQSTEIVVRPIRGEDYASYEHADVPYELTADYGMFGDIESRFSGLDPATAADAHQRVRELYSEQKNITQSFWYSNGGLDTLSFYKIWPDGYVNEGRRVSGNLHGGDRPMANEIITYGVGVLRPRKPEHKGMGSFLAELARRVDSRQRRTFATYIVDIDHHDGTEWTSKPRALESTNLVMPETLGELRQLADRREEEAFMKAYLTDLQATVKPVPVHIYTHGVTDIDTGDKSPAPRSIVEKKWRWREAHRAHISSGLWSVPPVDTVELMDRVDELLGRINIDDRPTEQTHQDEPSPELLALCEKYPDLV